MKILYFETGYIMFPLQTYSSSIRLRCYENTAAFYTSWGQWSVDMIIKQINIPCKDTLKDVWQIFKDLVLLKCEDQ